MNSDRLNDYARRIDRSIALLTDRLTAEDAPTLDDLAGAAAMSKFHFHRIFRLMTGETVGEMVRRIRLAKGSLTLDRSVTDAAGEAAYATSQAFARSMRAHTGMSVADAVRSRDIQALFAAPAGKAPLSIALTSLKPFRILAIRNVGDYAALNSVFARLFEIAGDPDVVDGLYGVYRSDPRFDPADECVFDAALTLTRMPQDTREAEIATLGGGAYLRLRHLGDYDAIPLAIDELTLSAISHDAAILGDEPPLVHYLDDPETCPEAELRADVHLPVRPA